MKRSSIFTFTLVVLMIVMIFLSYEQPAGAITAQISYGITTRASVASDRTQGTGFSTNAAISSDNRYVAFESRASNLVANDSNDTSDVFVFDRTTGQTSLVSMSSNGIQGKGGSLSPSISGDGRFVAFGSGANNLVPGDTNDERDVFVHERQAGTTTRVSVSSAGFQANDWSYGTDISGDGRFVAFISRASNLVPGDTNGLYDVFVHDRQSRQTTRVSVRTGGLQANHSSFLGDITPDGRYVTFYSFASNLVSGDTNRTFDVFCP